MHMSRMGTMKRDKMIEDVTEDVLEQRLQTFGLSRQESHLESTLSIRCNSSELFFLLLQDTQNFREEAESLRKQVEAVETGVGSMLPETAVCLDLASK